MTLAPDRLERLRRLEGEHFWSVGRDVLTTNLIERYSMSGPFVDAGAGTGAFVHQLPEPRAWFDTGPVDPGGVRASVNAMPFADGSIGTVLIRDVLEHVDDEVATAEIARVLRPGGHVLVTVPGWPALWGPRDVAAGHRRRYRRRSLRRVVMASGLTVSEMRGYQFVLLPVVISARMLARVTRRERADREESVGTLNGVLTRINMLEAQLARRRWPRPPTGSSLVLVGVKP